MKGLILITGLALFIVVAVAAPFSNWPFSSSNQNRDMVDREYGNSRWPFERYVARSFGDELPSMRNDLIERKNNGEGFWKRHYNAWKTPQNWKPDPLNDWMEKNN